MHTPSSELMIRGSALYLPITIAISLVIHRRPDRARIAAAVVAFVWNAVSLLVLNVIAQHFDWWTFTTQTANVAGMPADLWFGWALLWGAVPLLATSQRLVLIGVILFGVDLVMMPLAAPVVSLRSTWLLGEALCLAACLVPGLLLGKWTAVGSQPVGRVWLQFVAVSGLLLFVIPTLVFGLTNENWSTLTSRPRWHFVVAALISAPVTAMALQAVREFAIIGNGTPVPLDPPQRLVVTGPYAYVANPMQIGGVVTLLVWAVLIASWAVAAAAVMAAMFSAGLASWNEDGDLSRRFDEDWRQYRLHVRPWIPRWHPHVSNPARVFVGTTCKPCSQVGNFLAARRPHRLSIEAAESAPEELMRITYQADRIGTETGLAAIGRSIEHINLAWAVASWCIRLPLIRPILQLVADAVGAGPQRLARDPLRDTDASISAVS
jgi:protein-S-isoprenylcysteine O-methyltransferase Ste14